MEQWYWIELIGFDNEASDYGVQSFLDRTNTKVEGVSLLFCNSEFVLEHKDTDEEWTFPIVHCTYGGYYYGDDRNRQPWTNIQLKGLVKELQRHGVKVLFSVFDFYSHRTETGERIFGEWATSHEEIFALDKNGWNSKSLLCPIKRLKDGRYFEDIFIERFKQTALYYGFDGIQVADGVSSHRLALQNGDISDDLIAQFKADTGLDDPKLLDTAQSKTAYRARRSYLFNHLHYEWVEWQANRWARFYEKFYTAFENTGVKLYFNSVWTRDPFEAYLRYGIDYKTAMCKADGIMVEWAIPQQISCVQDNAGVYLSPSRKPDYNYEYTLTQQNIKAYLPRIKQQTMSGIKDTHEQWELMNVAPMEQESAFFRRNNNPVFTGERFENASNGPWYCLSSGLKSYEWASLNAKESVSVIQNFVEPMGILNVWSDCIPTEAKRYLQTRDYSISQIKYELFFSGLCMGGAVRAEDTAKVNAPLLACNTDSYARADIEALEQSSLPTVIIGQSNPVKGCRCVYQGEYLSVWLRNIQGEYDSDFAQLKKYDKKTVRKYGSDLGFGGLWTCPLSYNTLPKAFFKTLADIINRIFSFPTVISKRNHCTVTGYKTGEKTYRLLVHNQENCYHYSQIKLPFTVKSARVANKFINHYIGVHGDMISEKVCPRGASIVDIEQE